ncbi:uncharacterized protein SOCE836_041070 [Sorangium cellulosum]|uniref:Uncharacterized protein n=1 Tax=Sorangium cellulosum TaxID=56 RepID=A0A4P2QQ36_SORCE|nr:uncharacterized protein SOCE836_041070 [Sorangium cellulosum]WCQ91344.1 hypothetical protein NQZ70_04062 [Sorangium sp. Soce836]
MAMCCDIDEHVIERRGDLPRSRPAHHPRPRDRARPRAGAGRACQDRLREPDPRIRSRRHRRPTPASLLAGSRRSKRACYYGARHERIEGDRGAGGQFCAGDPAPGPTGPGRAPRRGAPDRQGDADRSGTASGERLLGAPSEAPEGARATPKERGWARKEQEARHALGGAERLGDGGTGHEEHRGTGSRRGPYHGWRDGRDRSLHERTGGRGARNRSVPRARDGNGDRHTQRAAERERLRRASRAHGSRPRGESRDSEGLRVQPRFARRDPSLQAREGCEARKPRRDGTDRRRRARGLEDPAAERAGAGCPSRAVTPVFRRSPRRVCVLHQRT